MKYVLLCFYLLLIAIFVPQNTYKRENKDVIFPKKQKNKQNDFCAKKELFFFKEFLYAVF